MAADQRRRHQPRRLARGCRHRPGRALADGPGGPGDVPGGARLHRAVPVRRQPDRAARRHDGRPRRHPLSAHLPRRHARHLQPHRGVPDRRQQGAARLRRATGSPSSRRASPSTRRWPPPTRSAARASRSGSSTSTRSSPSTAAPCARPPRSTGCLAHRRGPPPGGRPRRRGARRLRRRPAGAPRWCASPSVRCRARPPRRSSCTRPASTPSRSRRRSARWWTRARLLPGRTVPTVRSGAGHGFTVRVPRSPPVAGRLGPGCSRAGPARPTGPTSRVAPGGCPRCAA